MKNRTRASLLLVLASFIWGTAFAAQSMGMEYLEPFTFNGIRLFMAGVALLCAVLVSDAAKRHRSNRRAEPATGRAIRASITGGGLCGVVLFIASSFQQFGLKYTASGKAGFITALYIVIVPVLGLFLGRRAPRILWICIATAVVGLYFLSIDESLSISVGDLLVMLCALFFAVHILLIDHFSRRADVLKLACMQFFVCSGLSLIAVLIFEKPSASGVYGAMWPMLYSGVLSGGLAYTLQIQAQKDTEPALASLIMSLESVFAVLAGWALLAERLSLREGIGCVLVFAAIVLAQLPAKTKRKSEEN